mgnify:CR=1 FL=1
MLTFFVFFATGFDFAFLVAGFFSLADVVEDFFLVSFFSSAWLSSCLCASFKIFSASSFEISFLFALPFSLIKFKIFSSYTVPLKLAKAEGFF